MNQITNNPRTHILELARDKEIMITTEQYKGIKSMQAINRFSDPLEIHDADTNKIIHDGLMKDILWFREIPKQECSAKWICEFWTRHDMHRSCECQERYNMSPVVFTNMMMKLYPDKYNSTLTPEEIKHIISKIV